jgi:thiazole synthase
MSTQTDHLVIAGHELRSRLIIGTGKYSSNQIMIQAHERSGADMVTVAVRRVNLNRNEESLLNYIDLSQFKLLPNTAGCTTVEEAIRTAHLAREALGTPFIKLEVIGDEKTLFPDNQATLEAARRLVKEEFIVMPYVTDDLIVAKRLVDAGVAAVMPLAAPIGSGLGVQNFATLRILREQITDVPLIVDAGVGTASDAVIAMELGYDGVLMNTAIAQAQNPPLMAEAMKHAMEAGRKAFLAGRIPKKLYATASSPIEGVIR